MKDDSDSQNNTLNHALVGYKRSSFCSSGNCVEVAFLEDGIVLIRDSKQLDEAALRFSQEEWNAFIKGVKAGEFNI